MLAASLAEKSVHSRFGEIISVLRNDTKERMTSVHGLEREISSTQDKVSDVDEKSSNVDEQVSNSHIQCVSHLTQTHAHTHECKTNL